MLPSFGVTCLMITAMGVLPYYVRYGMSGDQPRVKDTFERYKEQQSYWESVRGGLAGRRALQGGRRISYTLPLPPPPSRHSSRCRAMSSSRPSWPSAMRGGRRWRPSGARSTRRCNEFFFFPYSQQKQNTKRTTRKRKNLDNHPTPSLPENTNTQLRKTPAPPPLSLSPLSSLLSSPCPSSP